MHCSFEERPHTSIPLYFGGKYGTLYLEAFKRSSQLLIIRLSGADCVRGTLSESTDRQRILHQSPEHVLNRFILLTSRH